MDFKHWGNKFVHLSVMIGVADISFRNDKLATILSDPGIVNGYHNIFQIGFKQGLCLTGIAFIALCVYRLPMKTPMSNRQVNIFCLLCLFAFIPQLKSLSNTKAIGNLLLIYCLAGITPLVIFIFVQNLFPRFSAQFENNADSNEQSSNSIISCLASLTPEQKLLSTMIAIITLGVGSLLYESITDHKIIAMFNSLPLVVIFGFSFIFLLFGWTKIVRHFQRNFLKTSIALTMTFIAMHFSLRAYMVHNTNVLVTLSFYCLLLIGYYTSRLVSKKVQES